MAWAVRTGALKAPVINERLEVTTDQQAWVSKAEHTCQISGPHRAMSTQGLDHRPQACFSGASAETIDGML